MHTIVLSWSWTKKCCRKPSVKHSRKTEGWWVRWKVRIKREREREHVFHLHLCLNVAEGKQTSSETLFINLSGGRRHPALIAPQAGLLLWIQPNSVIKRGRTPVNELKSYSVSLCHLKCCAVTTTTQCMISSSIQETFICFFFHSYSVMVVQTGHGRTGTLLLPLGDRIKLISEGQTCFGCRSLSSFILFLL